MPARNILATVATITLSIVLTACSGPASNAPPPTSVARKAPPKAEPRPAWADGEYAKEEAFFGHAAVPLDGDKDAAIQAARTKALENLKLEMELLHKIIKDDHEEQVAEIISRYPTEDFNAAVDKAFVVALESAVKNSEYTEKSGETKRLHVLFTIPIKSYYDALHASELPEEQKKRLNDYHQTYTDNVLRALARQ